MSRVPSRPLPCTTVRCRPDLVDVRPADGQTLLDALVAAGVPVTHACGGNARCSTCRVLVEDGIEACTPRTADEAAMAARLGFGATTRLACRTRLLGHAAGAVDGVDAVEPARAVAAATAGPAGPAVIITVRRLVLDALDLRLASVLDHAPEAVGREIEAAVLFADVADFTPLSEALPAYDVVHLLDRWFALAGPAVEANGGRIDNYMGDGLMAVFAAAGADAVASSRAAVRAGLALVERAADLDRMTLQLYGRRFAVRVGIHTGRVVAGTLGAAHNRRETVIGDAVNVAARLEAANKEIGSSVLVSDVVATHLGQAFALGRTAAVALKGKSGTHRVHEVLGPQPEAR